MAQPSIVAVGASSRPTRPNRGGDARERGVFGQVAQVGLQSMALVGVHAASLFSTCPSLRIGVTPGAVERAVYAARRSYRWWSPPTCGIAITRPLEGRLTGRGSGESFSSDKCVRDTV